MSPRSAGLAVKMGYTNVKVYLEGDPYWQDSGRYLVPTDTFVLEGNIILIDLRDAQDVAKGHIPRAVHIPLAGLEDASDQFPNFAGAPIVFYGSHEDVTEAAEMVRGWGYRTVSGVDGGFERWVAAGLPVVVGDAAEEIVWKRQLGAGEIALADFQQAIAGERANSFILDVRGPDEVAGGMIAGAVNIPLDDIEKRIGELPTDRDILIHCATGARAEMAHTLLVQAGLKAQYCTVNVECENGVCTLTE